MTADEMQKLSKVIEEAVDTYCRETAPQLIENLVRDAIQRKMKDEVHYEVAKKVQEVVRSQVCVYIGMQEAANERCD